VTNVANIGQQRPNSDAKVFEVVVEVAEPDTTLRPAMTTSNTVLVAEREEVMHVPIETLHSQGDSLTYVFRSGDGSIVRQEVAVGLVNDNSAIVERGLGLEDEVFLSIPPDTSGIALRRLDKPPSDAPAALPQTSASTDDGSTDLIGDR